MKSRMTLLIGILGCFVGCGAVPNETYTFNPTRRFSKAKEKLTEDTHCAVEGQTGCANLYLLGNAVGSGTLVHFKSMYTSCKLTDSGYVISITNSRALPSTLEMKLSFYKNNNPSGTYTCIGPEILDKKGVYEEASNACTAIIMIQDKSFATTKYESCEVYIEQSSPMKGTVECEELSSGNYFLIVDSRTDFECPQ